MLKKLAEYTFNKLMNDALSVVDPNMDKRQGSVIYDTLAGACYNLAITYANLIESLGNVFPDTAIGEWLDKNVGNFGLTRKPAENSIVTIETRNTSNALFDVPIGSRFSYNQNIFRVSEKLSLGKFKAVSEVAGKDGNISSGSLVPVDNIANLATAAITEITYFGSDAETDDELRARFYTYIQKKPFSGNVAAYVEWAKTINGVGAATVFPIWNGPGTVKVVIGNTEQRSADTNLVNEVQALFGSTNKGDGIAPIGHFVTVSTSTNLVVNVTGTLVVGQGVNLAIARDKAIEKVQEYINGIEFAGSIVYVSRIISSILDVDGILDVQNVKLNGSTNNITLTKTSATYQVPVPGTVTLT